MTILDSDIFASAGGGGMAKLYSSGMMVKQGESVRSKLDAKVYVRFGSSPESLSLTVDPAVYYGEFTLDDESFPVGSMKQFPDAYNLNGQIIIEHGQWWLRTSNYIPLSTLPPVRPETPPHIITHGDYFDFGAAFSAVGLSGFGTAADLVGDANGNWMMLNTSGGIFKSSNNIETWTSVTTPTTAVRIATNGAGRWWYLTSSCNVYVSDNFGTSWTLQTTSVGGFGSAAGMFKFAGGRLHFSTTSYFIISSSTPGASTNVVWTMSDSNSTGAVWTPRAMNTYANYPNYGNNANSTPIDVVWDGLDTFWYAFASGDKAGLFTYKLSTESFIPFTENVIVFMNNSTRSFDRIIGLTYNGDGTATCIFLTPYQDVSNGELFVTATTDRLGKRVFHWTNSDVTLTGTNSSGSGWPLGGLVRKGCSTLFVMNKPNGTYSTNWIGFKHGRKLQAPPFVSGLGAAGNLRLLREVNGVIVIVTASYIARSVAAVGRVPLTLDRRIVDGTYNDDSYMSDYMRVL